MSATMTRETISDYQRVMEQLAAAKAETARLRKKVATVRASRDMWKRRCHDLEWSIGLRG